MGVNVPPIRIAANTTVFRRQPVTAHAIGRERSTGIAAAIRREPLPPCRSSPSEEHGTIWAALAPGGRSRTYLT